MFPMCSKFQEMDSIFTCLVFMAYHHIHFTPSMLSGSYGTLRSFLVSLVSILGAAMEIYSPLEKMIVIRVVQKQAWWFHSEILLEYKETQILVTQHQFQIIIQEQKGAKVQKKFPKYGGKDYLHKFVFYGFY